MNKLRGLTLLTVLLGAGTGALPRMEAQATPKEEKNTVGEISKEVAQVRFEKLGYKSFGTWTRNGDYWQTTAMKDGKSWQLGLHVRKGTRVEKLATAR
jgi:hypothetical protein